jgi:hypothetical protein
MRLSWLQACIGLFLAAMLSAPAWATNTGANSALPGTLNYVEGQAFVADQPLNAKSVGQTILQAGQSIETNKGKAEILLTPGVFVRAGDNTQVKIVALGLTNTELQVVQGEAMVEAAELYPQNNLRVVESGVTTRIAKPGLYDFDAAQNQVRVFDGQAAVLNGDKEIKVKGSHEVMLASNPEKSEKFNKKAYNNEDLYSWSSLRSAYLAEANIDAANVVLADGWGPGFWGPGWWGPGWGWGGWFWDPWFSAYTFLPGGGLFYSPFGWGFYSPRFARFAPIQVGHYYHTFNAHDVAAWGAGRHYLTGANGHIAPTAGLHAMMHAGPARGGARAMGGGRAAGGMRGFGSMGGGMHMGGGFHER